MVGRAEGEKRERESEREGGREGGKCGDVTVCGGGEKMFAL